MGDRMSVVVTGGAGFIGANVVRTLLAQEWVEGVRVIDDRSSGEHGNLDGLDVMDRTASILDRDVLDEVVAGADAIVHLAALPSVPISVEDPVTAHQVNATGTLEVLEAARRHGNLHTLVASSAAVYGDNPALPKHEGLRPEPLSPYGVSKLATEAYATTYGHCYDLPTLALRFFNVYGPLQPAGHAYASVVPALVDAALAGRPLPIHGDGQQTRDFVYVGSVAAIIVDAVRRQVTSDHAVNVAFGTRQSLLDLVDALRDVTGTDLLVDHQPPRPGDIRHSQADQTRLTELFPDVQPVDFREGLRATVDWFMQRSPA